MQEVLEFFWEQHLWRGETRLSQGRNWTTELLHLRLHIQSYRDFWTSDGPSEWFCIEAEKVDFCTPALLHPLHLQECNSGWGSHLHSSTVAQKFAQLWAIGSQSLNRRKEQWLNRERALGLRTKWWVMDHHIHDLLRHWFFFSFLTFLFDWKNRDMNCSTR